MQSRERFEAAAAAATSAAATSTAAAEDAAARADALRYNFLSCLFLAAQNGFGQDVEPFLALSRETWGEEQLWAAVKDLPHGPRRLWEADRSPMWVRDARGAIVRDKDGNRVQAVDPFGAKRTRVMYAAQAGKVARLQWLIARGARLELKDWEGLTALSWASREGRVDTVRELLTRGAAVNTVDNYGRTPLFNASMQGHLEVVRELLVRGAAVDNASNIGATPLSIASWSGHLEVVRELLTRGAVLGMALISPAAAHPLMRLARTSTG
jgi:hypothetical protein